MTFRVGAGNQRQRNALISIMSPPRHPHWPRPGPSDDVALDLWLHSALSAAYDGALREPVPEHLLQLARQLLRNPEGRARVC